MKNLLSCLVLVMGMTVACTTPQTPAQSVYLVQSQYAAALRIELAYSNLPRCGKPTSPKLCSDVDTIRKVQKADDIAWTAIGEAQKAVRTRGFGESKITTAVASARALTQSFVSITNQLGVK